MKALIEEALDILRQAKAAHENKLLYACSMSAQGMVLMDLIAKYKLDIRVITLDTGRLPEETYTLIAEIQQRYGCTLDIYYPDTEQVAAMVSEQGINLFRDSVENRKKCCSIRKVQSLKRALVDMEAWITGRRKDESDTRATVQPVEQDLVYGLLKYNPMLNWTEKDVWLYIKQEDLPYNALYNQHYASIGCECCTRAITVGEDPRAGRWWWENEETLAECGLHVISLKASGEGEYGDGI